MAQYPALALFFEPGHRRPARDLAPDTDAGQGIFMQKANRSFSITLDKRLEFETMLTDLSSRFIHLPVERIDQEIVNGLKQIVEVLGIDRCSVCQFDENTMRLQVTHAYSAEGVSPMPDTVLNEQLPWYYQLLRRGDAIVMARLSELPTQARAEKAYCRQLGVKSSVHIPLAVGGAFLGGVAFAELRDERVWPEVLIKRLRLVGEIFANALMRSRAEHKLRRAFDEIKQLKDRLEAENSFLREEITLQCGHESFIGQSKAIQRILIQAEQVAATDATVLVLGETGTGKELLAQEIHKLSRRRGAPMVTVNCAALPSELIESELFGHEKGAFTGAQQRRIGRFELADGSTLFLDEIGELPTGLQVKLLRVLQTKTFERLGGQETIRTDARVIAATNRDLLQAVHSGQFRSDLYYRLNVFPITIPPLREHPEDIPEMAWFFVKSVAERMGKRIDTIPRQSMKALQGYRWPGNVRELKNILERAVIVTQGRRLQVEIPGGEAVAYSPRSIDDVQKAHILKTLETTGWRIRGTNGAAELLGLKPTTLESRMARLGIRRPPKPQGDLPRSRR
jgi:transcriptional regulator with GAF, ATPase, and Fis domain